MSKVWRGKNGIPLKIPQKLYYKYSAFSKFFIEVIPTVPIEVLDLKDYKRHHEKELETLGLNSEFCSKSRTSYMKADFIPKILDLPWKPSLGYSTFKCYPIFHFHILKRAIEEQKHTTSGNILNKVFYFQQLFRNKQWEAGSINLSCRKLNGAINLMPGVEKLACKEIKVDSILHEFYDNFSISFPRFIEDFCYSFLTEGFTRITAYNYSWMIQAILSSKYLIPKSW